MKVYEVGANFAVGDEVLFERRDLVAVCKILQNLSDDHELRYRGQVIRVDCGDAQIGEIREFKINREFAKSNPAWGLRIA